MKFSEIVPRVIAMAREANKARLAEGLHDDSPILASGADLTAARLRTSAERRLHEFLEAQPPSVAYLLTAIMYLGRGDFDAKEVVDQYTDMRETFGGQKWAARQMLERLPLPEYLEEGLKKLARARLDVDKLIQL